MIYLLQDCYKDDNGEYKDILKIGYSKNSFTENRENQYNTHNFGYKFLGEKEGSIELENYLHKLFKKYNLDREWFNYSQEIIDKFWSISENDISDFTSQDELNEYIRSYILNYLVPTKGELSRLYLKLILDELKEKDLDFVENETIYKKEILNIFEFISSRGYKYYNTLDFNLLANIKLLKKCGLYLPQMINKQKDNKNFFEERIITFYKTKCKFDIKNESLFRDKQSQRRKESYDFLDVFNSATLDQQAVLIKKLKNSIQVSQYSEDFISISKKTGLPVYNSFIEIANERAWEVSQKDYQDKINVTKALNEVSTSQEEYLNETDQEVADFLDNHFYKTGIFKEKMKMYCEFMDKHKGNQEILDKLNFKIKDEKFKTFYNFYGTKGCSSAKFEEKKLTQGMMNVSKESELYTVIYNTFKVGDRLLASDVKSKLTKLYNDLGIKKKAKASDLSRYFNLVRTRITNPETKKLDNGFRLDPLV